MELKGLCLVCTGGSTEQSTAHHPVGRQRPNNSPPLSSGNTLTPTRLGPSASISLLKDGVDTRMGKGSTFLSHPHLDSQLHVVDMKVFSDHRSL